MLTCDANCHDCFDIINVESLIGKVEREREPAGDDVPILLERCGYEIAECLEENEEQLAPLQW